MASENNIYIVALVGIIAIVGIIGLIIGVGSSSKSTYTDEFSYDSVDSNLVGQAVYESERPIRIVETSSECNLKETDLGSTRSMDLVKYYNYCGYPYKSTLRVSMVDKYGLPIVTGGAVASCNTMSVNYDYCYASVPGVENLVTECNRILRRNSRSMLNDVAYCQYNYMTQAQYEEYLRELEAQKSTSPYYGSYYYGTN